MLGSPLLLILREIRKKPLFRVSHQFSDRFTPLFDMRLVVASLRTGEYLAHGSVTNYFAQYSDEFVPWLTRLSKMIFFAGGYISGDEHATKAGGGGGNISHEPDLRGTSVNNMKTAFCRRPSKSEIL